jgi:hypothetical protein
MVFTGCGVSPAIEPEAAVPEGAVVVPPGGVSCGLEGGLRSRLGAETKYRITNDTTEPVNLFWLDYGGQRHAFGSLQPGESTLKITFAGHVWLATDASGSCVAAGVATARMGELRIGGEVAR